MPTYRYESKDKSGKVQAGVLNAANMAAAFEAVSSPEPNRSIAHRRTRARAEVLRSPASTWPMAILAAASSASSSRAFVAGLAAKRSWRRFVRFGQARN